MCYICDIIVLDKASAKRSDPDATHSTTGGKENAECEAVNKSVSQVAESCGTDRGADKRLCRIYNEIDRHC